MRNRLGSVKTKTFTLLGVIFVIFAVIGIFVPLWPRTPFAIAASMFFAKSNPKLHSRLIKSRLIGPYLENYYFKTGMTMGYKIRTCIFMWIGLIVCMLIIDLWWLYVLLSIKGVVVSLHLFTTKTKAEQEGRMTPNNEGIT